MLGPHSHADKVESTLIARQIAVNPVFNAETPIQNLIVQIGGESFGVDFIDRLRRLLEGFQKQLPPVPFGQKSLLGQIPAKNKHFVGRKSILEDLEKMLDKDSHSVVYQTIAGMGGVGKTQVVTEFIHRAREKNQYALIVWLDAEDFERAYRDLGADLKANVEETDSVERVVKKVHAAIAEHYTSLGHNVLIVFDGVKDQKSIDDYLPSQETLKGCHCLISSRSQNWNDIEKIALDVFSPGEAKDFIKQRLGEDIDTEKAQKLAEALGHLPLALTQATAYILNEKCSIDEYIALYKHPDMEERRALMESWEPASISEKTDKTIWSTWYISMQALMKESPDALRLIEQAAFLSGASLSFSVLATICGIDLPSARFNKIIRYLTDYSLLEEITETDNREEGVSRERVFRMHSLTQEVIRLHLQDEMLDDECYPEEISEPSTAVPERELESRRYLASSDDQWLWCSREYLCELVDQKPMNYRVNPEELRVAQIQQEDPESALKKLSIPSANRKRYHVRLVEVIFALNRLYEGDRDASPKLLKPYFSHIVYCYHYAVKACVGVPVAASLLVKRATAAAMLGQMIEAREYFELLLVLYEDNLHTQHPRAILIKSMLAMVYGDLGDLYRQEALYETCFLELEAIFGSEHASLASKRNNLAVAKRKVGKVIEACNYAMSAIAALEKPIVNLKDETRQRYLAKALTTASSCELDLGDFERAKALLNRAIEIKKLVNEDEGSVAVAKTNLARLYIYLEKYAEAKILLEEVLEVNIRVYGKGHYKAIQTEINLAELELYMENYEAAIAGCTKALDVMSDLFTDEYIDFSGPEQIIGRALIGLNRYDEAKEHLLRSLSIRKEFYTGATISTIDTLCELALCMICLKKLDLANEYLTQAEALRRDCSYILDAHPSVRQLHKYRSAYMVIQAFFGTIKKYEDQEDATEDVQAQYFLGRYYCLLAHVMVDTLPDNPWFEQAGVHFKRGCELLELAQPFPEFTISYCQYLLKKSNEVLAIDLLEGLRALNLGHNVFMCYEAFEKPAIDTGLAGLIDRFGVDGQLRFPMGLLVNYLLMIAYAQLGGVPKAAELLDHMKSIVSSNELDQAMLTDMEELYTALLLSLDSESEVADVSRATSPVKC